MIRPATIDDLQALYRMCEAYFREHQARTEQKFDFDWVKVASRLYNWLHDPDIICFIEAESRGAILGEIDPTWFGSTILSHPHWAFVYQPHRNGLLFRNLLRAYIKESERRGALYVYWDDWNGMTDPQMLQKLLTRVGFERTGGVARLTLEVNGHATVCSFYPTDSGGRGAIAK